MVRWFSATDASDTSRAGSRSLITSPGSPGSKGLPWPTVTSPLHHCPTNQNCALTSVAVRPRSDTTESAVGRGRMGRGGGGRDEGLATTGQTSFHKTPPPPPPPFFTSSCIFHEFMNSPIQREVGGRGCVAAVCVNVTNPLPSYCILITSARSSANTWNRTRPPIRPASPPPRQRAICTIPRTVGVFQLQNVKNHATAVVRRINSPQWLRSELPWNVFGWDECVSEGKALKFWCTISWTQNQWHFFTQLI